MNWDNTINCQLNEKDYIMIGNVAASCVNVTVAARTQYVRGLTWLGVICCLSNSIAGLRFSVPAFFFDKD